MRNSFDQSGRAKRTSVSRDSQRGISPNGRATRWLGVAAALRARLQARHYAPHEALPSTRELAQQFEVHRHTVLTALDALVAEGLLRAERRRGYFVCEPAPELTPRARAKHSFAGFRLVRGDTPDLEETLPAPKIPLHAALPDSALLPIAELRAAYSHVLQRRAHAALNDSDERGVPALRRELTRYLRRARGFVPAELMVTHGSQEAIVLVAQVLLGEGETVLVEDPGYPQAARAFRALGANVVPMPVDAQGLRVDAVASYLSKRTARLLYTTPNHHYPTTVSLSAPRRAALLQLTREHGLPVLEDDYNHEYHYRGLPQPPLAAAEGAEHVLYVGTLSKLVVPSVRVGFLCADAGFVQAALRVRRLLTRGYDAVTQAALADWMADGGLDRHLRRARRVYAQRRDAAVSALAQAAREVSLEYAAPDGGLALWTVWPDHDVAALANRAAARGVWVLPETFTRVNRRGHGIRLAFGRVTPAKFAEGLEILVQEAKRLSRAP